MVIANMIKESNNTFINKIALFEKYVIINLTKQTEGKR